uniref:Secreted protein n=1 Tax=Anguilla anguilla TaxID=7936 RepID=A0A0E9PL78_ANGAN
MFNSWGGGSLLQQGCSCSWVLLLTVSSTQLATYAAHPAEVTRVISVIKGHKNSLHLRSLAFKEYVR